MNKMLPLTLTLLASSYVATANSDDAWYLGALYNAQDISTDGRDFNAFGITAGYQFNNYFSVESRFSKGTSGYSTSYDALETSNRRYKEDIDSQVALLAKGSYPILDNFEIYALVGYTNTKIEVNGLG
ncbi:outer membrane beta-barrel protein [Bowmanella sp. Y26]|uniref:outer membrane beta-barrel protein n=1 Tax=Bowmanella yangjiangensis TaxID=2811230 RepID=UPI001BDC49BE|nr:outer membrane beta-barrel protein [Bowmanella yangjiangensis]MBT1063275.1 outer membrane beta-barrel protein [Bowmanella yangjiangensis]